MNLALRVVNPNVMSAVFARLTELEFRPGEVLLPRPDTDEDWRGIIRHYIIPVFHRFKPGAQQVVLDSLRYYLTADDPAGHIERELREQFESHLPPYEAPEPCTLLYRWLWEEILPGVPLSRESGVEYVEELDTQAVNSIWLRREDAAT